MLLKKILLAAFLLSAIYSAFANSGTPPRHLWATPLTHGTDRPFNEYTWLTSHNAFAVPAYGWTHTMQAYDLEGQLRMGARGFMLDVHMHNGNVKLCHGYCFPDGFGGSRLGYNIPTFTRILNIFGRWMSSNRSAVVTLILEDYTNRQSLINAITASSYEHMIFDASGINTGRNGSSWPTLQSMINSNRRIVILSSRSSNTRNNPYVSHLWTLAVENTFNILSDTACTRRSQSANLKTASANGSNPHKLFIYNHFRNAPAYVVARRDNARASDRWYDKCYMDRGGIRKPNFLTVDYIGEGTPIHQANEFNRLWAMSKPAHFRMLKNRHSGLCADIHSGRTTNGTNVMQWNCHGGINQRWVYDFMSGFIMSETGVCLDNTGGAWNGGRIQVWQCVNSNNLRFDLRNGTIRSRHNHNIVVDGYGTKKGDNIGQWTHHGGSNQKWDWVK